MKSIPDSKIKNEIVLFKKLVSFSSHDLRASIGRIISSLDLLQAQEKPDPEFIEMAIEQAQLVLKKLDDHLENSESNLKHVFYLDKNNENNTLELLENFFIFRFKNTETLSEQSALYRADALILDCPDKKELEKTLSMLNKKPYCTLLVNRFDLSEEEKRLWMVAETLKEHSNPEALLSEALIKLNNYFKE